MPKASQKSGGSQKPAKKADSRKTPTDDDDDEDYAEPSQGRGANAVATARKFATRLDQEEVMTKTNDLVRYLLIADQKKIPIKKSEINKVVLKDMPRAFEYIMDNAKTKLEDVFGVSVIESDAKAKSYMLVNKIALDKEKPHLIADGNEHAQRGLLVLVLSVIFMNHNEITEAELWHALAAMNLSPERTSDTFGDVKRLITGEWVRQGWVEYSKRAHTEPPEYELRWGARARAEVSKRQLLDFVCEIHGDGVSAQDWREQWQDVLKVEEESGEA